MPKKGGCQGKLSFLGIYYEKVIKNQLTVSVVFLSYEFSIWEIQL